jgi:hypothetical protein
MRKKTKKFSINKKVIFLVSILLIIFFISKSLSKYLIEIQDTHSHESTAFYFESDIADVDEGKKYNINDWDGKIKTIDFTVKNYINNLLKTNEEITYKMSANIVDDSGNIVNDDSIELLIVDNNNKTINENSICTLSKSDELQEEKYTLKIVPQNNLGNDAKLNIKLLISSQTPYTKDLIANFTLAVDNKVPYEANLLNSTNGEYVTLNLKINDPQDITITYDNSKLILDKSQNIVNNTQENTTNSFTITKENLKEGNNYQINFIKIQTSEDIALGTDIEIK